MIVEITITEQDVLSAFAELRTMNAADPYEERLCWYEWDDKETAYSCLCPVARAAQRAFPGRKVSAVGKAVIVEDGRGPEFTEDWANDQLQSVIQVFDDARTSVEVLEKFSFPMTLILEQQ